MPLDMMRIRCILKLGTCLPFGGRGQEVGKQPPQQEDQKMLVLQRLERTMDPLIAAQIYNRDYSPIYRLPTELLLLVIDNCMASGDQLVSEYLRRVSRRFRLLIDNHFLKSDPFKFTIDNPDPRIYLKRKLEFIPRIQGDGLCAKCKLHRDSFRPRYTNRVRVLYFRECEFGGGFDMLGGPLGRPKLHCGGCGAHHHKATFAALEQGKSKRRRQCLGRQGSVRLCDHVSLYWHVIERHITDWQQRGSPGGWEGCFDDFLVECRDPSHGSPRCAPGCVPTWPRARLRRARDRIVLHLEWAPHSGPGAFGLTRPDKQALAPDLRSLFRRYRRGAASCFFPSCGWDPLPEMACFSPNVCGCLYYETGGETVGIGGDVAADVCTIFRECSDSGLPRCTGGSNHSCWGATVPMSGKNTTRISMDVHPAGETGGSVCLVTTYEREIMVCHGTQQGKLSPSHWWLHAMDPTTYPRPPRLFSLPLCWDENCSNYRRKPAFSSCHGGEKLNWECIKDCGEVDGCRAVE
ncbi:hypothetical protein B0T25DRAFT_221906 [Lasiosphaeria hispida]|uniref:F-box domain-containing protein n=1 Tax=Lasiosphaeria hispida TaxID=260671 RepID=A0AAJ0HJH4_9PEZI|nr:hypothetical protein B0T25DRAFT_221906 [Lasiosphaeria hispida]